MAHTVLYIKQSQYLIRAINKLPGHFLHSAHLFLHRRTVQQPQQSQFGQIISPAHLSDCPTSYLTWTPRTSWSLMCLFKDPYQPKTFYKSKTLSTGHSPSPSSGILCLGVKGFFYLKSPNQPNTKNPSRTG